MKQGLYLAELTNPDKSGKRFRIIDAVSREDAVKWLKKCSPIRRVKYYYQQRILREIIMPLLQDVSVERFNVYLSKAIRHRWKAKEPRIYTFP